MRVLKILVGLFLMAGAAGQAGVEPAETAPSPKKVYVLPIREDIMPPLVYLVRRGVKEAMEAKADLLVVDMETNGGRLDTCREIISILGKFQGDTVTYVNKDAFSAGAFIAVATRRIYMAPESVIGAAAPVMLDPTGGGVAQMPDTFEKKTISAVRALIRATAEKNGHNVAVVEAMIDKDKGLSLTNMTEGATNVVTIAKVGEILTLTNTEAEREYGSPPKKLLSAGTAATLEELLSKLGYAGAERRDIRATGAEQVGFWLNAISPLLLMIGIIGIYIEFKTPGFGVPGIIAIAAFALYFLGGYVAGLSGLEWVAVFLVGVVLLALELFFFPGTAVLGLSGAALMLTALVMATVDMYPGMPKLPGLPQLRLPIWNLSMAFAGAAVAVLVLNRLLPRTRVYRTFVSETASGVLTEAEQQQQRSALLGQSGVSLSSLRPGGKAQFGNLILDVISQGDLVPKGTPVKIIGFSGTEALVEVIAQK